MSRRTVLGVDGGNTKTIAVAVASDGEVVGAATGGCTDVYGAVSAEAALAELESVIRAACDEADVDVAEVAAATLSLAGADWPEDHDFLATELSSRLPLPRAPIVMNDSLGPLDIGTENGVGVSLVCGTFLAVGARSGSGAEWHSSFWAEPGGAYGLGSSALRAAYREEIGLAQPTAMTPRLLELYEVSSTEDLLKRFTRRVDPAPDAEVVYAARILLDEADRGDTVAVGLVEAHVRVLHDHVLAAAGRVGLGRAFDVVLAGGIFTHDAHLLEAGLASALRDSTPLVRIVTADLPPVGGAALHALRSYSGAVGAATRARLAETIPAFPAAARRPAFSATRRHA